MEKFNSGREYFYYNYSLINGNHPEYRDSDHYWVDWFFHKKNITIEVKKWKLRL